MIASAVCLVLARLKKDIIFDEQGQLATLLSVKESKEKIIEAGLCFLKYINYGDKKKLFLV